MTYLLNDDDIYDDYDTWAEDWQYATSSDDIAELLIDKLAEKALTKTMWARVIAALHEEYHHKFCACVEVDEPATAR
jgi:hypothetical protein